MILLSVLLQQLLDTYYIVPILQCCILKWRSGLPLHIRCNSVPIFFFVFKRNSICANIFLLIENTLTLSPLVSSGNYEIGHLRVICLCYHVTFPYIIIPYSFVSSTPRTTTICSGGPAFEDWAEPDQTAHHPAEPGPAVPDPLLLAAFREIHKLRGQATKDYESLRGYTDTYRTMEDNLEGQVTKWCDELEQLTTKHDKTVNTYLRTYHHLEGATNGLMTRARALEA